MLTTIHNLSQMDILDRSGQKLGRVRDVLLDAESGRADYLLMTTESGGFPMFAQSGTVTPIPLSMVTMRNEYLSIDAPRDEIRGAPSFSLSDVSIFTADYRRKLDNFWGIARGARDGDREHVETGTARTAERPYEAGAARADERRYEAGATRPDERGFEAGASRADERPHETGAARADDRPYDAHRVGDMTDEERRRSA